MSPLGDRPIRMATAALALYGLLLLPMLISRQFDASVFIIAGDRYVDSSRLDTPIAIRRNSFGYDGQFFYRLALDPFSQQPIDHGITFDDPAKRAARIVYPSLAWLTAFGQPRLIPATLVAVNLVGLAALAGIAAGLTRGLALPGWTPFAIMAWPGLLITLTDDTAEILAAALLLAALACYLSNRLLAYVPLAALATLTRETTVPMLAGVLAVEAYRAVMVRPRRFSRAAVCGLALLPFGLWREVAGAGQTLSGSPDLGWPLLGAATSLVADLDGSRAWSSDGPLNAIARVFVVLTSLALLAFCVTVAVRLPRLLRRPNTAGPAIGWALTVGLMSLLTADQSWLDPHGYFRAFTETYVVGCLLLAMAAPAPSGHRAKISAGAVVAVTVGLFNWLWCWSVLP